MLSEERSSAGFAGAAPAEQHVEAAHFRLAHHFLPLSFPGQIGAQLRFALGEIFLNARAPHIRVNQQGAPPQLRQRNGQVHGDCGFPLAALRAGHQNGMSGMVCLGEKQRGSKFSKCLRQDGIQMNSRIIPRAANDERPVPGLLGIGQAECETPIVGSMPEPFRRRRDSREGMKARAGTRK